VPQSPDEAFPLRVIRQPPAKPFHRLRRRGVLQAANALEEAMGVSIIDACPLWPMGLTDSGETDWQSAADLGLRVWLLRPAGHWPVP